MIILIMIILKKIKREKNLKVKNNQLKMILICKAQKRMKNLNNNQIQKKISKIKCKIINLSINNNNNLIIYKMKVQSLIKINLNPIFIKILMI